MDPSLVPQGLVWAIMTATPPFTSMNLFDIASSATIGVEGIDDVNNHTWAPLKDLVSADYIFTRDE